jgi:hypothetical protein
LQCETYLYRSEEDMPNIRKLSGEEVQRLANTQADREPAQMTQSTQPQELEPVQKLN